jgi:FKBP-type peptidyl-prolyl cis-trans isomerase FklB
MFAGQKDTAAAETPVLSKKEANGGETPAMSEKDRQSYAIGADMATMYKRLGIEVDADTVAKAMKDVQNGQQPLMTKDEVADTMADFRADLTMRLSNDRQIQAIENKKAGEEFLAANKAKEGVTTLPSGLQFKRIVDGTGKQPTDDDTVVVHYVGTLTDGTEFEDTHKVGHPMTFKMNDPRVIEGLREILKLMPVGSKWQVFIPSRLAFQNRGAGKVIGPNVVLVYELELLSIE